MALPVVFRGYATVEGTAGTFDAVISNATALNQTVSITQQWEEEVIKDNHGYDIAWLMRNEHATMDIDLMLMATTAAIAAVPVQAVAPSAGVTAGTVISALNTGGAPFFAAGSQIHFTGFTMAAFNGYFRVLSGCDAKLTNSGAAKYTLKLLKYAGADQQTAFATIPT